MELIKTSILLSCDQQMLSRYLDHELIEEHLLPDWLIKKTTSKSINASYTRLGIDLKIQIYNRKLSFLQTRTLVNAQLSQSTSHSIDGSTSIDLSIEYKTVKGLSAEKRAAIRSLLTQFLQFRKKTIKRDAGYLTTSKSILVSGSTGFIGSYLMRYLSLLGHRTVALVRKKDKDAVFWNPARGSINLHDIENFDVVIHLSGENIASGKWTDKKKHRLLDSRITTTDFLVESLNKLKNPPKKLLAASAVGIYQSGFIRDLTEAWETSAKRYTEGDVTHMRFASVLSPSGGMIKKLLPLFQSGFGSALGNGQQTMSWISLGDLGVMVADLIASTTHHPYIDFAAPFPVSNQGFSYEFATALGKKLSINAPKFALRFLYGQLADEVLLQSNFAKNNERTFEHATIQEFFASWGT